MQPLRTYAVALAGVALVALGLASLWLARAVETPFAGFLVYRSGAVTSLWRAEWPGRRAGLRVRDVVTEVAGEPVGGGPEVAAALGRHAGDSVEVAVRGPGGERRRVVVPVGKLRAADLGYTLALPFSIGVLYWLLGAVIFGLKPTRESFLVTMLFFVASAFYLTMFDAHTTYRFTRVWLVYPLLGPLSVHLFALFPEERPGWARAWLLGPLYAVGLAVVAWRQAVLADPRGSDVASLASSVMLSLEFALDLGLLGCTMLRGASRTVRNRAKSMFVGLALTCTASVAWQFASRAVGAPLSADEVMVLSALFPALIAYAILKRNLFDLDAVLRAGLIYGLASAFVLAVYFAVVAVAGHLIADWAGRSTAVAVGSTLVAALLFHPVRVGAQRIVDRVLFREAGLLDLLPLLRALPGVEGAAALAGAALPALARLTGARAVALLARAPLGERLEVVGVDGETEDLDGASVPAGGALERVMVARPTPAALRELPDEAAAECAQLAPLGPELVVPLVSRGALVGLIVLSSPRRGVYGYPCLRALGDAAPQLALALENAALVAEGGRRERLAALGQLAAVIVHEVKNPLGIIKVAAGTLRSRARDDTTVELASCVEDEVDRIDVTVRRLLELARPPGPSARRPCDLAEVARQTLERLGPELAAANIEVAAELGRAPTVSADVDELRSALLNLLINARQAMPSGGRLSVRVRRAPGDGVVEVEIEDTGVGMDEATRRQLFRPFFTTRHGGTGLGLALVKRVVEDHRGAIRVESRPGRGSRFTVTFPT
jgi:signal transduction histidine kinase